MQDDAEMDELEAPLYIGGLPGRICVVDRRAVIELAVCVVDDAPVGTLKTRDNFKGCIRNIKVGDRLMDWIDMDELSNVRLNSCPVLA